MLAICEDCSKKYNIDESKMKGQRARCAGQEGGHIIVVVKSETSQNKPEAKDDLSGNNDKP